MTVVADRIARLRALMAAKKELTPMSFRPLNFHQSEYVGEQF